MNKGFEVEHIQWVFSGVGVLILGAIFERVREAIKNGVTISDFKAGYVLPNTLSYFSHGRPNGENVSLVARRIISVKMLRTKKIKIRFPVFSMGTIDGAISLSDPDRMNLVKKGETESFNRLEINGGKRGSQYLVVTESQRHIYPKWSRSRPSQYNIVLTSLFDERLKKGDRRDFAGTRIIGTTLSVRLIVEFDESYHPQILHPIQIDKDGSILRDERSSDFIIARRNNNTLFILDLYNPEPESGVYFWWDWPQDPQVRTDVVRS